MLDTYKQCEFRIKDSVTVAWIPSWAAVKDNLVQLRDSDNPKDFWIITKVGNIEKDAEQVRSDERNYKYFQGSTRNGGID